MSKILVIKPNESFFDGTKNTDKFYWLENAVNHKKVPTKVCVNMVPSTSISDTSYDISASIEFGAFMKECVMLTIETEYSTYKFDSKVPVSEIL